MVYNKEDMDRQKTIPPLSTKITRKLAQESADHNSLMNFYSSISRDETGAPKKWKMSSPLLIDEQSITSKKGTASNRTTPTGSRENSNERKQRQNNTSVKSQRGGRRKSLSRDGSSSSRESSLDSKDNNRDTPVVKKKRGRPKSLDLKDKSKEEKTMANGDSDNFKSPDPLTPCNITVKRKKGRPKETPPVLVAEAPVEPINHENEEQQNDIADGSMEELEIPVKRKPGRPRKRPLLGKEEDLKSRRDKLKPMNLKTIGSKLVRNKVRRGFKKFGRPKQNKLLVSEENLENSNESLKVDQISINEDGSLQELVNESLEQVQKRPRGRPPKVKKKTFFNSLTALKNKNRPGRPAKTTPKFNPRLLNRNLHKGRGRPPGSKNKPKQPQSILNTEKDNENLPQVQVSVKQDMEEEKSETVDSSVPVESGPIANDAELKEESKQKYKAITDMSFNAIDEAIESVVFKARNDEPIEVKPRIKDHFKSSVFYKKRPLLASTAKVKKQKDLIEKIRKKRMLKAQAIGEKFVIDTCNLASNDLRRKLHSKLIEKMSLMNQGDGSGVTSSIDAEKTINSNEKAEEKSAADDKILETEIQNVLDASRSTLNAATNIEKAARKHARSSLDRFSDSESICSDLSSISMSSKRPFEKQILILGEDNVDSDDSTVRTRQRFEIIPGKKRKRTLSGEFDLLDEKQLRKLKKKEEKDQSDVDSDKVKKEEFEDKSSKPKFKRKNSPLKKSQNLKVKDGKVNKKTGSQYLAYKNRLLKQSPFLNKPRRRRRKFWRRNIQSEQVASSDGILSLDKDETSDKTKTGSLSSFDSVTSKPESYRAGLFEKFSADSDDGSLMMKNVNQESNIDENTDARSDDTESTIELKDMTGEEHEDMLVEESVDDSDAFNFHAEDDIESSSGKILYTDSELEVREMLFELIDSVVNTCELKNVDKTTGAQIVDKNDLLEVGPTVDVPTPQNMGLNELRVTKNIDKVDSAKSTEHQLKGPDIATTAKNDENKAETGAKPMRKKPGRKPKAVLLAMKKTNADGTEKVRKKPGRKPKMNKTIIEQNTKEKQTSPVQKQETAVEHNVSPTSGGQRKFELRQKISRSPLDNIALKQSLEENKYLKSEAQRVIRKEAKLKSKLKATNQESSESLPVPSRDEESKELQEKDKQSSENEAEEEEEEVEEKTTVEDIMKDCKPCKVILKDFIKELERTQGQTDSSDSDFDSQDSQDSFDADKLKSPLKVDEIENSKEAEKKPLVESNTKMDEDQTKAEAESLCKSSNDINSGSDKMLILKENDNTSLEVENRESLKVTDLDAETKMLAENKLSEESKDSVREITKTIGLKSPSGKGQMENPSKETVVNVGNGSDTKLSKTEPSPKPQSEPNVKEPRSRRKSLFKPKSAESVKSRTVASKTKTDQVQEATGKTVKPLNIKIGEPQTARKTVPPLKIKVKGSFSSRRKTYIVEPYSDFLSESVEKLKKPSPKHEKKRSKIKSGNKSESSDSEKHKIHHHKRKNKSLNVQVPAKSKSAGNSPQSSQKMPERPVIKATDAYEANFLQFIQDKDKVEQNMAAYTNSFSQKHKDSASGKSKKAKGDTLNQDSNSDDQLNSVAAQDEKSNDSESNDVQYVCSQCDSVVYRAKEDIVKHYAEVHPGNQFIYKPLPETSPESNDSQTDVNSNEKKDDTSPAFGKVAANDANAQLDKQSPESVDQTKDDDDETGSLNLKIVDVVSLKDQNNILNSETLEFSKSENTGMIGQPPVTGSATQISGMIQASLSTFPAQIAGSRILQPPTLGQTQLSTIPSQILSSHLQTQLAANPLNTNKLPQQFALNPGPAELKIPAYPLLHTSVPSSYAVIVSRPPPPYSAHTISVPAPVGSSIPGLVQARPVSQVNHVTSQPLVNNIGQPGHRPQLGQTLQKQPAPPGKLGHTFKCEKCNVHAPMLAALVAHLRNSHKEIPRLFQCPYCKDMEAESEAQIHQHIKQTHPTNNPNPPVALSEAAKRNLKTLNIKLPENVKLGEGNNIEKDIYMCLKCKDHKPSLEAIYEHLEQQHSDVFSYVCPVCKVFKSPMEEMVNRHLMTSHGQTPGTVNISLAIDGNHFVRVQCLIKEKQKSSQKGLVSPTTKQHSPSLPQQNGRTATPSPASDHAKTVEQASAATGHQPSIDTLQSLITQQQQRKSASPSIPSSKPVSHPPQKKKKTLLESIEQLTVQKLEEQAAKSDSASPTAPSHPSQLQSSKPSVPGGAPPPLMRGPPPLIRYDQLNKVSSAQSAMFTSTVRTSSSLAALNPATSLALQNASNIQKLQNMTSMQNLPQPVSTSARPIQSSLFDTSDLEAVKSSQNQRPVLNVPVVPRMNNQNSQVSSSKSVPVTGTPLDLTKTTPSPPVPPNVSSPNPQQTSGGGGINPEIFKVFNLRPGLQMQIPRPQGSVQQQIVAQPIMVPQQVRQNTPSTLAYRPQGSQIVPTSQIPQFITMPVGAAVIGNMVVNVTQPIQTFPVAASISALQNAQFVRMSLPQGSIAGTTMSCQAAPTTMQAQPPKTSIAAPFPKNMLFKCPYCPKVTPLRLDQVKQHIENQHPGSAVIYQQFETK